jgi:hypothetical protein
MGLNQRRVYMYADPLSRARRRFRRRRDYASEQHGRNRRSEGLPEVVAQRRSSFAVVCACSVYFVISNLPPGQKKKKVLFLYSRNGSRDLVVHLGTHC